MSINLRHSLVLAGTLFFLAGCAKNNNSESTASFSANAPESLYVSDTNKVALDLEQMSNRSAEFKKANRLGASAAQTLKAANKEDLILPQGQQLLVVVDNLCGVQGELSHAVQSSDSSARSLSKQAMSVALSRAMKLSELSEMADKDDCVVTVANDGVAHATAADNDTNFSKQLQLQSIQAAQANDILLAAGSLTEEVIIAVIDTGVQLTHPDLKDNLWMDANGNIGTNLIRTTATADDDNGHGTHCSGLAAAMTNNNLGVAGVMPTKAKIMPIKALDSKGAGSFANITNGIYYAIDHKANVISMSLGGDSASSALRQAIVDATNAGIMVFAAAGNDGKDLSASPSYPAFYAKDIDGFMAIASIDSQTKKMSNFSNYSSDYVELAAPGSNGILSTYKGSAYAYLEGTSMATPIAAGAGLVVMSWLKSHGYVVTAANVEKILKAAAEVNLNLADLVQDSHNLNLASLANYLKTNYSSASTMPTPTPTPAPTPMLTPMPTPQPTPVITPTPTPTPKPKPTPRHRSRSSWGWRW